MSSITFLRTALAAGFVVFFVAAQADAQVGSRSGVGRGGHGVGRGGTGVGRGGSGVGSGGTGVGLGGHGLTSRGVTGARTGVGRSNRGVSGAVTGLGQGGHGLGLDGSHGFGGTVTGVGRGTGNAHSLIADIGTSRAQLGGIGWAQTRTRGDAAEKDGTTFGSIGPRLGGYKFGGNSGIIATDDLKSVLSKPNPPRVR